MKSILLVICFLLSYSSLTAQNYRDSIDIKLEEIYQNGKLPGFAVTIVNEKEILYAKGYGYADVKLKTPFTERTIENIGSVSKTFAGLAIAQLIDQGKLHLETPINDVLPFKVVHPKFPETTITLRHLVTHTSGIRDSKIYGRKCYVAINKKLNLKGYSLIQKIQIKALSRNSMVPLGTFLNGYLNKGGEYHSSKNFYGHKPGTKYEYSNIGSAVAAMIVEHVTGMNYGEYSEKHLLGPMGMSDSGWQFKSVDMDLHATNYFKKQNVVPRYTLVTYPDGGLISNATNLGSYLQWMLKGKSQGTDFLSKQGFDMLYTAQHEEGGDARSIFWEINKKKNRLGHNGADPGVFSNVSILNEQGIGLVGLTNIMILEEKEALTTFRNLWQVLLKYGSKLSDSPTK